MHKPRVIPIIAGETNIVYTPISLFQDWVNNESFPTRLTYGQRVLPIQVLPHPDQKEQYMITASLQQKLSLLHDQPHHLYENNDRIHVGPVVGIFTAGFTNNLIHPFGERTKMFAKLLNTARRLGVTCYVFGAQHINWDKKEINGYLYKKSGWTRSMLPFPNIIYDRLPNRKIEELSISIETKKRLETEEEILWFNPGFFDKWTVYEKLHVNESIQSYLPKTIRAPQLNDIEQLLDQYKNVYLKPTNGSLGNGIQQILKRQNDPYYYIRFRSNETNRLRRYTSLKRLIRKQFPKGTEEYMAQQGIHLVNWNGKAIDFRVHTNRGRTGEWETSAVAAKLAGTGSITTHITSGGKTLSLAETIHDLGHSQAIVHEIKEAALLLSEALSSTTDKLIGEIGFDIGIDEKGAIWMFEANSKPGRSIFDHPNLNAYDRKTLLLPFEFSIYLFEQSLHHQVAVRQ